MARVRETPNLSMTLIAPLWPEKAWFADLLLLLTQPPPDTADMGPPSAPAPLQPVPRRRLRPEPTRVETVKLPLRKSGLSGRASHLLSTYVRESTARLDQSQWLSFCRGRSIAPLGATISVIVDFLIHLRQDKGFSLSALKGYCSAITSVLNLKGLDLANSKELYMLFRSLAKTCHPQDLRPPAWDVALVLQSLTNQPYEPMRETEERFLAQKTLFLVALALAKRVGELHAATPCLTAYLMPGIGRRFRSVLYQVLWPKLKTRPHSIHGSRASRYRPFRGHAAPQTEDSCAQCERSVVTSTAPPNIARVANNCSSAQDVTRRRCLRTLSPSGSVR